jgi:hypothetical protein
MGMTQSFALGQTVRIAAGTYHGAVRPDFATVIGEGANSNTYKLLYAGWHMTFHADELDSVTEDERIAAARYAI